MAAVGKRGGTVTQPPPPGGEVFGPTDGRTTVIAQANPRPVTDPGGGVTFTTRSDLQTKINSNPAGTKFVHAAGGTEDWDAGISAGNKAPKIYFLGLAGSTSTVIDAAGRNIIGLDGDFTGAPVELHGGRWTDFGNSPGTFNSLVMRDGWLVEDAKFDNNFQNGFACQGSDCIARYIETNNNGISGWNTSIAFAGQDRRTNNVYEHINTHHNNQRLLNPGTESGGCKMLQVRTNVGRYIYCHDNLCYGLWIDVAAGGTVRDGNGFEECVVENNSRTGLFLESVTSGGFLRHNWVKDNGVDTTIGGEAAVFNNTIQIRITNADQTLNGTTRGNVSYNYIDFTGAQTGNLGGLVWLWNHDAAPDWCKNWDVHNNQWWLRSATSQNNQRVGGNDSKTTGTQLWDDDNDFFDNEYHVISTGLTHWRWDSGAGGGTGKTYAQWQAFHPGDDIPLVLI